ncbi:hypothetical protein L0O74_14465, partial [Bifidobacterium longum]|nr:hypothetical protein [Bifidobacterium longum]
ILMVSAIVQFLAKNLPAGKSLNLGLITLVLSFILLGLCMSMQWSILFFISDILGGVGHGFGLMGAFGLIH